MGAGANYGVAPGAQVRSVKVLSDQGSGSWSWSYEALDWLATSSVRPAVASMSLGGNGVVSGMKDAVDAAVSAGVTVVVAAGNSNADACGFSPAYVPNAVTVGSTDSNDARSYFSCYGTCVDTNRLLYVGAGGAPTPVPTPAPPPGSWTVTGTGCTKVGNCIQSNNHPSEYGNNEACTISANNVAFTVDAFNTESGYDFLIVGGASYSGTSGPANGSYNGDITWSSDYSVTRSGWKLCQA